MMHYTDNELDRDLKAIQEEAPPMPESLRRTWKARIALEPQMTPAVRRPVRTYITRGLAAAAAAVFVITGATMTADLTPVTLGGMTASGYRESRSYDSTSNGSVMYSSRATGASVEGAAYDSGIMLTAETQDAAAAEQERKIIRNVSLSISTETWPGTLDSIKTSCEAAGGWIESISESGESGSRRAWLTLRIPADKLDSFLESAGSSGRVTDRSESAQDVTESYYDTQSRLESQQTLLNRLHELVSMAETLEDILALESQIADTQYQIDRLQESLLRTDRQVDYATVDITLRETTPADQAADTELSFGQRIIAAFRTGGEVFAALIEDAAVWLVSAVPFAAVVAVIWLFWRLIRRNKNKAYERK